MSRIEAALFYLFDGDSLVGILVRPMSMICIALAPDRNTRKASRFGERDSSEKKSW